jgi:hypothetical protein
MVTAKTCENYVFCGVDRGSSLWRSWQHFRCPYLPCRKVKLPPVITAWITLCLLCLGRKLGLNLLAPEFYIEFKSITNLTLRFFSLLSWRLFTAQHVSGVPAGPTTNTARLSPRYESKTRGCHCSHRAPNDGRENVRNMLSCKQTSG